MQHPSTPYTLFSFHQSNLNSYFAVYRASILPNCLLSEPSPRQDWLGPLPMSRSTRETRPSGTLLFYLSPSTISRLALSHRPKYRSLFAPICRSFHQSRYLPFSPSSCFVTSDCPVKLTPMSHLLGVYWNFVLFLSSSSSPSSLVVSIFSIFSFLPFSNPPLIEAGGSISIRFQNSFISRSAITDDMDDAYRDPWKIKPRLTWKSSRFTVSSFLLDPFRILAI